MRKTYISKLALCLAICICLTISCTSTVDTKRNIQGNYILDEDEMIRTVRNSSFLANMNKEEAQQTINDIKSKIRDSNMSMEISETKVNFKENTFGNNEYSYIIKGDTLITHDEGVENFIIKEGRLYSVENIEGMGFVFKKKGK